MASSESTGLPICSDSVLPCSSMVPAGTRAPLFFSASLMDWMLAPEAAMASGRGRILMCCVAPPVTSAPRTPSSFCSRGTREPGEIGVQFAERLVRGDGEEHDREIADAAGDGLRLDVVRQRPLGVGDGPVDLVPGPVQVRAVGEHHADLGDAVAGRGRRRLQPLDAVERRLQRAADLLVHDFGRGSRHRGDDRDLRELDGRDELLLERGHRDHAEHRREDGDQRDQGPVGQRQLCEPEHLMVS